MYSTHRIKNNDTDGRALSSTRSLFKLRKYYACIIARPVQINRSANKFSFFVFPQLHFITTFQPILIPLTNKPRLKIFPIMQMQSNLLFLTSQIFFHPYYTTIVINAAFRPYANSPTINTCK